LFRHILSIQETLDSDFSLANTVCLKPMQFGNGVPSGGFDTRHRQAGLCWAQIDIAFYQRP